jgi:hypothetical protein
MKDEKKYRFRHRAQPMRERRHFVMIIEKAIRLFYSNDSSQLPLKPAHPPLLSAQPLCSPEVSVEARHWLTRSRRTCNLV